MSVVVTANAFSPLSSRIVKSSSISMFDSSFGPIQIEYGYFVDLGWRVNESIMSFIQRDEYINSQKWDKFIHLQLGLPHILYIWKNNHWCCIVILTTEVPRSCWSYLMVINSVVHSPEALLPGPLICYIIELRNLSLSLILQIRLKWLWPARDTKTLSLGHPLITLPWVLKTSESSLSNLQPQSPFCWQV